MLSKLQISPAIKRRLYIFLIPLNLHFNIVLSSKICSSNIFSHRVMSLSTFSPIALRSMIQRTNVLCRFQMSHFTLPSFMNNLLNIVNLLSNRCQFSLLSMAFTTFTSQHSCSTAQSNLLFSVLHWPQLIINHLKDHSETHRRTKKYHLSPVSLESSLITPRNRSMLLRGFSSSN